MLVNRHRTLFMPDNGDGSGGGGGANDAGAGNSSNQNQNQNGNGGNSNNQNGGGLNFDPMKDLSEDQWKAIYQSGRFKELNDKAKVADQLQKERDETERKQLEQKGEWEKLAKKNEETAGRYKSAAVNAKIEAIAAKLGSVDPEAVVALLDKSNISVDDNLNVKGVEEAINELKASKGYLFNNSDNNRTTRLGSPANPGSNNTGSRFKLSQTKNPKFYRENRAAILDAMSKGQIENDLR